MPFITYNIRLKLAFIHFPIILYSAQFSSSLFYWFHFFHCCFTDVGAKFPSVSCISNAFANKLKICFKYLTNNKHFKLFWKVTCWWKFLFFVVSRMLLPGRKLRIMFYDALTRNKVHSNTANSFIDDVFLGKPLSNHLC